MERSGDHAAGASASSHDPTVASESKSDPGSTHLFDVLVGTPRGEVGRERPASPPRLSWTERYYEALAKGASVREAVRTASSESSAR